MRIGNIKSMQYLTLSRQVSLSVIIFVTNWTSPPSVKLSFSLAVLTEVGGGRWPVLSFVIWSNSPKNGGLHIIKSNVLSSTLLNAGESIFISWSHFTTTSNEKKRLCQVWRLKNKMTRGSPLEMMVGFTIIKSLLPDLSFIFCNLETSDKNRKNDYWQEIQPP